MDSARLTDPAAAKAFVMAGNATFTLRSTKTGARFTYRVRTKEGKPSFVSLLSGSDNDGDYQYMGTIFNGRDFRITAKSRIGRDAPSAKAFAWIWDQLTKGKLSDAVEFWHEGRCARCGRKLTVPESIASGFGPECAKSAMPKRPAPSFRSSVRSAAQLEADREEAEMAHIEAEGDRAQTLADELAKWAARDAMEARA